MLLKAFLDYLLLEKKYSQLTVNAYKKDIETFLTSVIPFSNAKCASRRTIFLVLSIVLADKISGKMKIIWCSETLNSETIKFDALEIASQTNFARGCLIIP